MPGMRRKSFSGKMRPTMKQRRLGKLRATARLQNEGGQLSRERYASADPMPKQIFEDDENYFGQMVIEADGFDCDVHSNEDGEEFPADKLRRMFAYMLSATEDRRSFIDRFSEHTAHKEVQRIGLECLAAVVTAIKFAHSETLALNLFSILKLFRLRNKQLEAKPGAATRKHFEELWLKLLSLPLTPVLYRRVLILLPERVLPFLENPLRLTDFLLSSYQVGGVVSVLALQGVFYLIQHHNLEYPDFYAKLYLLLEPNTLLEPQRARFFHLVDVFLGSGYLPEYLVAAFVKRLSRLLLTAPAPMQTMLIRLVCSLMVRHRGLQRMTDDPRGATEMPDDPYRPDQAEPANSGAAQSALWEIKSLRGHLVPQVCRAASFVDRELPQLEHPLDELLDTTYHDLLEAELNRRCQDVALTFYRPEGLLSMKEDRLNTKWKL